MRNSEVREMTREVIYPYYTMTHFNVPYVTEEEALCIYHVACKIPIIERAERKSIIVGLGATKTEARRNLVYVMEVEDAMPFKKFMTGKYAEQLTQVDKKYLENTHSHSYPYALVSSKPHYFYFGGKGKTIEGELERFKDKFKIRGREAGARLRGKYNFLTLDARDAKDLCNTLSKVTNTGMHGERPDSWRQM
jgi:ribosomal protein L31